MRLGLPRRAPAPQGADQFRSRLMDRPVDTEARERALGEIRTLLTNGGVVLLPNYAHGYRRAPQAPDTTLQPYNAQVLAFNAPFPQDNADAMKRQMGDSPVMYLGEGHDVGGPYREIMASLGVTHEVLAKAVGERQDRYEGMEVFLVLPGAYRNLSERKGQINFTNLDGEQIGYQMPTAHPKVTDIATFTLATISGSDVVESLFGYVGRQMFGRDYTRESYRYNPYPEQIGSLNRQNSYGRVDAVTYETRLAELNTLNAQFITTNNHTSDTVSGRSALTPVLKDMISQARQERRRR